MSFCEPSNEHYLFPQINLVWGKIDYKLGRNISINISSLYPSFWEHQENCENPSAPSIVVTDLCYFSRDRETIYVTDCFQHPPEHSWLHLSRFEFLESFFRLKSFWLKKHRQLNRCLWPSPAGQYSFTALQKLILFERSANILRDETQ